MLSKSYLCNMQLFLYPFSFLYAIFTNIRNLLFDIGILSSKSFRIPIICIGNLSVGGTGKTPLVLYVVSVLKDYNIAILSRGYGRNTNNYLEVDIGSKISNVGDEPLLIKEKNPECVVAVDGNRKRGILNIIKSHPEIDIIILDDGFQHRSIKAGLNIITTNYTLPYYKNFLMPMGTLRESKKGSERADIIVVSKCPKNLNPTEKKGIVQQLGVFITQRSYFSHIEYKDLKCLKTDENFILEEDCKIILVTGIANSLAILEKLAQDYSVSHIKYKDHHNYNINDINDIIGKYKKDISLKKIILTTEKDAIKLKCYKKEFINTNIYYIPIETKFEDKNNFDKQILKYAETNKRDC